MTDLEHNHFMPHPMWVITNEAKQKKITFYVI